jgi:hypothetical protein
MLVRASEGYKKGNNGPQGSINVEDILGWIIDYYLLNKSSTPWIQILSFNLILLIQKELLESANSAGHGETVLKQE